MRLILADDHTEGDGTLDTRLHREFWILRRDEFDQLRRLVERNEYIPFFGRRRGRRWKVGYLVERGRRDLDILVHFFTLCGDLGYLRLRDILRRRRDLYLFGNVDTHGDRFPEYIRLEFERWREVKDEKMDDDRGIQGVPKVFAVSPLEPNIFYCNDCHAANLSATSLLP